jgi:hypothetical protein
MIALLGLTLGIGSISSAHAVEQPLANPPESSSLVAATNSMLQPNDVVGALTKGTSSSAGQINWFTSGYNIPPGGQDPMPICVYGSGYTALFVPMNMAIGYSANFGTTGQDIYQYPSAQAANAAWTKLSTGIEKNCRGSFTEAGSTSRITWASVPGAAGGPAGYAVASTGSRAQYTVTNLVGDAIQVLTYSITEKTLPSGAPLATRALAVSLAQRWADRANAVNNQSETLTKAETDMLNLGDVPASLPVTTPADGGWSGFSSYQPGSDPDTCNYQAKLPKAESMYSVNFGGNGGPLSQPGAISQSVYDYGTNQSAQSAWAKLRSVVLGCNDTDADPISQTEPVNRRSSGVSELSFDGVAGVWSRTLNTNPNSPGSYCTDSSGKRVDCDTWSSKTYRIYLLVGTTIQSVTYYVTKDGVGNVPLDQVPVNALAEQLATRWQG